MIETVSHDFLQAFIISPSFCQCLPVSMYTMMSSKNNIGASLAAQWLRIHLPLQDTQVQALVQEDPTCRGTTNPVRHNYWACALEPMSHNYWSLHA